MRRVGTDKKRRGWRLLIAGTGGQGVLTAARLLCDLLVKHGHDVVSGQLHGMAQRGGSVQASVIVDCGISPVIPAGRADCVLGFEPVETARALPFMSSSTLVCMNTTGVMPYVLAQRFVHKEDESQYPDIRCLTRNVESVTRHLLAFDATRLAAETGSTKTLNMVMLGSLVGSGALPWNLDGLVGSVVKSMPPALAERNSRAFSCGLEFGSRFKLGAKKP